MRLTASRLVVRRSGLVLAVLISTVLPTIPALAQPETLWRPMGVLSEQEYALGMAGGEGEQHMHGLARSQSNPDVLYLAHDCATFWRSDDAGLTWNKLPCEGMFAQGGESVEVDPLDEDRVFAMVDNQWNYLIEGYQGVYRSTDGGETWTQVLAENTAHVRSFQRRIAFDPTSTNGTMALRWYVAAADHEPGDDYVENPDAAIWRSDDGGDTWVKGASLVGHDRPAHLYCHPTDGQTLYLASEEGLFVSTDRGATLQPLGDLPAGHVPGLAINPQDPNEIWATVWHDNLYRSTDGGQTFASMDMYKYQAAYHIFLNPAHPDVLYYVPEWGESWVSSDGGASWQVSATTPRPALSSHWKWDFSGKMSGVSPDPRDPQGAWGFAKATFFRTDDGGATWTDSASGFTGFAWGWWHQSIAWDPDDPNRWMMFCYDVGPQKTENNGLWFTSHGVPWDWINRWTGNGTGEVRWGGAYSGEFQPGSDGQVILTNFGYYFYTKLCRSTDGGDTWEIVIDENNDFWYVGFHPDNPNCAWAGTYRSEDGGVTWIEMSELLALGQYAEFLGYDPANPDTVYAHYSGTGRIYRSTDRGATWALWTDATWKFASMDRKPVILVHPTEPHTILALNHQTGGLAKFDGTSWTQLGLTGAEGGPTSNFVRTIAVDPRHGNIVYLAMNNPGFDTVFRSTDGGQSWENISSNLSRVGGGGLQVNPHTGDVMYGGCFGTWVYPPPYDSPDALYHRLVSDLLVTAWQSAATHGPAGEIALDVDDGDTEPRDGGPQKLLVTFNVTVDVASASDGAVTVVGASTGDQTALIDSITFDASGRVMTIGFAESLPDDVYAITLSPALRSTTGLEPAGDVSLTLAVRAGDVDGSGAVDAEDLVTVRQVAGAPVAAGTAFYDVNRSGTITGDDLLTIRAAMP